MMDGMGWMGVEVQSNNVLVYRSAEPIGLLGGGGEFIHIYTHFFDLFQRESRLVKYLWT